MNDLRESLRKCIDAMPDPVTRAAAWKGYALAVEDALENAKRQLDEWMRSHPQMAVEAGKRNQ